MVKSREIKNSLSEKERQEFNLFMKDFAALSQHNKEYFMSNLMPAMVRLNIKKYTKSLLTNNFEAFFNDGRRVIRAMEKTEILQNEIDEKMDKKEAERSIDKEIESLENLTRKLKELLRKIVIEKVEETKKAAEKSLNKEDHSAQDSRVQELENMEGMIKRAIESLQPLVNEAKEKRDRLGCFKGSVKEVVDFYNEHKEEIEAIKTLLEIISSVYSIKKI